MSAEATKLLEAAMVLPAEVRAEMADRLMASLYEGFSEGIEHAWAREADERVRAFHAGEIPARSREDVWRGLPLSRSARS